MRPFAEIVVPTLHAVVAGHAARRPAATAIVFGGARHDYSALEARANRFAHSLLRDGMTPGDRILFLGRNSDAVPLIALGANKVGVVPVPLNWRLAPAEIATIVQDCAPPLLIAEPDYLYQAEDIRARSGIDMRIVPARSLFEEASGSWLGAHAGGIDEVPDAETIAIQVYTSGSTGGPKGVMLSHRALLGINMLRGTLTWDHWGPDDVTLAQAPLGHIGAFGMMARALFFGATAIIHETFDPAATIAAIEQEKISKLSLVPTAIKMILDLPQARQADYRSLDTIIYGSAPIAPSLLRAAIATFGCRFAQSYGMTETTGPTVALPPEDHDPAGTPRMEGAGKALPATELRIADTDGRVLPAGETGEIHIRSIANMSGYFNLPDESARTLDPDAWVHTGDAGYLDVDGYLYVRGRVKEMIISGAENVYPAEVENAIVTHPDVAEVAVIGLPDDHWGEAVTAIVVTRTGTSVEPQAIRAWARERIAPYKVPKMVRFVETLPLNATGKVDRRALQAQFAAASPVPSAAGVFSSTDTTQDIAMSTITPPSHEPAGRQNDP
jgi:acyl-CoA synthetase (AMP-forming)/AMP-acid ligase II